jgi:hypothetical protein
MKSVSRHALFATLALACPAGQRLQADSYAVLFSGGADQSNNWDRYYNNTSRMWSLLTGSWGYDVDHVYVLFADGTDPYLDQHESGSGLFINSDWSMVTEAGGIIRSATHDDLESTLAEIGGAMTSGEDSFYFWSFDHGYLVADQGSGSLVGWDMGPVLGTSGTSWEDELIYTSEISTLLNPITLKNPIWEAYVMTQCYAGDFLSGLGITSGDTNRFFAYAAQWNEESYGDAFADAWADGMELGLTGTQALGEYAVINDIYGEHQGDHVETPGWIGGDFSLVAVPEPASFALGGGFAALALAAARRRKTR